MQYFNNQELYHKLVFLPRETYNYCDVHIHDELLNSLTIIENMPIIDESVYFGFEFRLNGSYYIELKNENKLIYRTKAKAI